MSLEPGYLTAVSEAKITATTYGHRNRHKTDQKVLKLAKTVSSRKLPTKTTNDAQVEARKVAHRLQYSNRLRDLSEANTLVARFHGGNFDVSDQVQSRRSDGFTLPLQMRSFLDPFVASPFEMSEYQRSRIQLYMKDLGGAMFGVTERPRYCPPVACGIGCSAHSKLGIDMICILVEELLHEKRGSAHKSKELVSQRVKGHQMLLQALRERDQRFQEAVFAMIISGLVEYRFGTAKSSGLHSTAFLRLLESKGSLREAFAAMPAVEPVYVAGQFGFGRGIFDSMQHLENVKQAWIAHILYILNSTKAVSLFPHLLRASEYKALESRVCQIAIDSCITIHQPRPFAAAVQTMMLHELAWIIHKCDNQFELAIAILKRIEFLAENTLRGGMSGMPEYELRAAVIHTIICRARRDILGTYHPDQLLDWDVEITEGHINQQRIFQYLNQDGQQLLLGKFRKWLQTQDCPAEGLIVFQDIESWSSQITENWLEAQAT